MTLSQSLAEAAVAGRLAGLTLWKTADGQYQASISADRVSWRVEIHDDPVAALKALLGVSEPPQDLDIFG